MVRSVADGRPPLIPEWNEQKALGALNIQRVEFEDLDGNTQGYAKRGGKIAVSPIAALPHKTLFHEIAHSLLHLACHLSYIVQSTKRGESALCPSRGGLCDVLPGRSPSLQSLPLGRSP